MTADYVIVGAGSAGCAMAYRLAEAGKRVTVIEHGGSDAGPFIQMPGALSYPMNMGIYDWGFATEPEPHLGGRVLATPRGKVIGGSSSINGMVYVRGHAKDYDTWAEMGADGWGYADVLPYFKRAEGNEHGENAFHGGDGPLAVTRARITNPAQQAWIDAAQQAGHPYSDDHNGSAPEGFGPSDRTIKGGRRISTAVAYLDPARKRSNLRVETHAFVTRILFDGTRAIGVEYRQGRETRRAYAAREIVSSGGTFQSAQLLMLSGIGDADALVPLGIAPLVDLKGVGKNLHDHIGTSVQITCPLPVSDYALVSSPVKLGMAALRYFTTHSGPLAGNSTDAVAYLRSGAPGHNELDLKYYFLPMLTGTGADLPQEHGFSNLIILTRPESRGQMTLRSANPDDTPVIDTNYLAEERDRDVLRRGVRMAREILAQPAYAPYRGREFLPGTDFGSDAELDAYFRSTCQVNYEAVGSCRMGHDDRAVVDATLRVHGISGLRVVDGSVMPRITTGDPNAAIIMIAEKAAEMILDA